MKTIYVLQKNMRYGTAPKILRAYESRVDADDAKTLMERADLDDLVIVQLELETAQPHAPLPLQPRTPPLLIGKEVA